MHRVFVIRKWNDGFTGVVVVTEDGGGAEVHRFQGLSYGEVVKLVAEVAPEGAACTDQGLIKAVEKLGKKLTYVGRNTPYKGVFRNGSDHPVKFRGQEVPPGGEVEYEALVHDPEVQRAKAIATRAFHELVKEAAAA